MGGNGWGISLRIGNLIPARKKCGKVRQLWQPVWLIFIQTKPNNHTFRPHCSFFLHSIYLAALPARFSAYLFEMIALLNVITITHLMHKFTSRMAWCRVIAAIICIYNNLFPHREGHHLYSNSLAVWPGPTGSLPHSIFFEKYAPGKLPDCYY